MKISFMSQNVRNIVCFGGKNKQTTFTTKKITIWISSFRLSQINISLKNEHGAEAKRTGRGRAPTTIIIIKKE